MPMRAAKREVFGVERRSGGRPRKFTHDQIVQAALEVMEREAFAALSYRSLAEQLKVSHTALFKYVSNIEDLETEVLQRLAALIPVPQPGSPKELRKQYLDCLLVVRELLLKHPGMPNPPIGSRAWKTFSESVVQWVAVLTPFAGDAFIAHGTLVDVVARNAERMRHYGANATPSLLRAHDKRLPRPKSLREVLDNLLDRLFPGLPKSN